ncbi:hypothetical protein Ancab_037588 [Ancistrocladus abbreviatus]
MEPNEDEPNGSDTWAAALMAVLDCFKTEKMEQLVAFQQKDNGHYPVESEATIDGADVESQLRNELTAVILPDKEANESKQHIAVQLNSTRAEPQTMSTSIQCLNAQTEKEQVLSAALAAKCEEFEHELRQRKQELKLHQTLCNELPTAGLVFSVGVWYILRALLPGKRNCPHNPLEKAMWEAD